MQEHHPCVTAANLEVFFLAQCRQSLIRRHSGKYFALAIAVCPSWPHWLSAPEFIGDLPELLLVIGQAGRIDRPVPHEHTTLCHQVLQLTQHRNRDPIASSAEIE